jgi:hypothetical protein
LTGGLFSGIGRVVDAAKQVAQSALNAALHLLGIKSPSREFMKVGQYSAEGLAAGLDQYSNVAAKSAAGVGSDALAALAQSLSGVPDLLGGSLNLSPTIKPVLDLSDVKKTAGTIDKVLAGSVPISIGTSYTQAKNTSGGFPTNQPPGDDPTNGSGTKVTFNQYNSSPKTLSTAEIYRQTNNQLSKVKEVVKP